MTNDKIAHDTYRKLKYFFDNKIKIHFKDFNNVFYNGEIVDLDGIHLTMVLNERKRGTLPFLLEQINPDSIFKMEEKA